MGWPRGGARASARATAGRARGASCRWSAWRARRAPLAAGPSSRCSCGAGRRRCWSCSPCVARRCSPAAAASSPSPPPRRSRSAAPTVELACDVRRAAAAASARVVGSRSATSASHAAAADPAAGRGRARSRSRRRRRARGIFDARAGRRTCSTDPLGLFRRDAAPGASRSSSACGRGWRVPDSLAPGGVFDLEGVPERPDLDERPGLPRAA